MDYKSLDKKWRILSKNISGIGQDAGYTQGTTQWVQITAPPCNHDNEVIWYVDWDARVRNLLRVMTCYDIITESTCEKQGDLSREIR